MAKACSAALSSGTGVVESSIATRSEKLRPASRYGVSWGLAAMPVSRTATVTDGSDEATRERADPPAPRGIELSLAKADGLIFTGPTGTNVNDLTVLLIRR